MRRSGPPPATVTVTRAGTRALIEVLLLHRRLRRDAVLAGIRAALAAGSVSADVVAIEARKHITTGRHRHRPTPSARPPRRASRRRRSGRGRRW